MGLAAFNRMRREKAIDETGAEVEIVASIENKETEVQEEKKPKAKKKK